MRKNVNGRREVESIHCPMEVFDFFAENPKLIQCLIASGSIPPPSSSCYKPSDSRYRKFRWVSSPFMLEKMLKASDITFSTVFNRIEMYKYLVSAKLDFHPVDLGFYL